MLILGIESSCDETGVALYEDNTDVLVQVLHSQQKQHAQYGGVVPEIASRDHIRHIAPLLEACLYKGEAQVKDIEVVAYTAGPGLSGALLVGAAFAQGLAFSLNIPIIPINHLEGHLLSTLRAIPQPKFPFIALLVSGGHTQLFKVNQIGSYQLIGESLDDAAGEVFDKTAKFLGLPYPGGAKLSKLAQRGNAKRFTLPKPLHRSKNLMMSFSGLKTAATNLVRHLEPIDPLTRADICCAFETAVVDSLADKCLLALEKYNLNQLVVAGGVSLNIKLRQRLKILLKPKQCHIYYPPTELCSDNAAMIAYAGALNKKNQQKAGRFEIYPRWVLGQPMTF